MRRYFTDYDNKKVPVIKGAFGGSSGGNQGFNEDPNSLFSTDILFVLTALGEGPLYRINPNGPQDIEITENSINDLIKIDGDGTENTDLFKTLSRTGTINQTVLRQFGQQTVTPQQLASPVTLKKGNIAGVPVSKLLLQETSARAWDEVNVILVVQALFKQADNGDIKAHSTNVRITFYNYNGTTQIGVVDSEIKGKTNTPYKKIVKFAIPEDSKDDRGYRFTVEKTSDESDSSKISATVQVVGWFEVENTPQAYPRTGLVGYAIKSANEHSGGVPTMSSLVKGLIVKVPSNYNQPALPDGQIDWRQLELPESGTYGYTTNGYQTQKSIIDYQTTNGTGSSSDLFGLGLDLAVTGSNPYTLTFTNNNTSGLSAEIGVNTTGLGSTLTNVSASASDLTITTYTDYRAAYPQYITRPSINTNGRLFNVLLWGDNGGSGIFDGSFKVSHAGTYNYKVAYYIQQATKTATFQFYVNGSLINTHSINTGDRWVNEDGSLVLEAGDVVRINMTIPSQGWAGGSVNFGADTPNNSTLTSYSTAITEPVVVANGDSYVISNALASNAWLLQAGVFDPLADPTIKTFLNPQIYVGTWDGTFVYSWTQNPVWIIYDILTNATYGLGIPEENIDKYKFYQVAQYCDACDAITGRFIGVDGQADGSFRHKPRGQFTSVRQVLEGIPIGTAIKERRFICDTIISDQRQTMEVLNSIAASFRGTIVHSFGKISLAVDQPDQLPVMVFNETNIKSGSFQISGGRESDVITGVEVSYIEPTNHYKRETVRIDTVDANDGSDRSTIENILNLDLAGVTRRSQALRFAQYQIAASRYLRRVVSFTTSTEALNLAPGDIISVSQNMTGINYGFGGKIVADSVTDSGESHVYLEHFTSPTLSNSTFTANTNPIALRVIKSESDRVDLYILSNSTFTLTSTDNVSTGFDEANVTVVARYNPITKTLDSYSTFDANNAPSRGDLWSIGEWDNPGNFYTNKAGKLFTVAEIERETQDEEINIVAKEYVSNVYVDSDTFIDYTPTAYTDIESGYSQPPVPLINLRNATRRLQDGSIVNDILIDNQTDRLGYQQAFSTQYFVSQPLSSTLINNTHQSVLTLTVDNAAALANNALNSTITGKNGFSSFVGEIKLLCNAYAAVDNGDGTSNVRFTVEGLNVAHDVNFNKHVLEVNDGSFLGLKGFDQITIPLKEKTDVNSLRNFIAYAPDTVAVSANITTFDKTVDTIDVLNELSNGSNLVDVLPAAPFYVTINQLLDSRFYSNNSFYVNGSLKQINLQNTITASSGTTQYIDLPVRVRKQTDIRLYVDGIEKSTGQFSLNKNSTYRDNVAYAVQSGDTEYKVEIDHYTVPAIEIGDNVSVEAGNTFAVINTSYDPISAAYNAALTANSIYRIQLETVPLSNLTSSTFTNVSPNPVGILNNISANTCTFDYDESVYPGNLRLGNNGIYTLQVSADYDRVFLTEDQVLRNVPAGFTSIRARNINPLKRTSPYVEKNILIAPLPIRKVTGVQITESLYREQSSGVAVRTTLAFDHITGQEVTDYEISYRLDNIDSVGTDNGGSDLLSFNTAKISASGVESDGKIRFTVSGINRGLTSETNSITFRITPLNKNIRGITTIESKSIIGKTSPPDNVYNFRGAQSTDQISLFWEYERVNDELKDLDLKEVVIRRIVGSVAATVENFILAVPFVTVAGAEQRITVPIDIYGTYTYLVRTRDTSGNLSEDVTAITLNTVKPKNTNVVAAYNEDSPSVDFTDIPNNNSTETNFPSFANSNTGGLSYSYTSLVDNANGTSSGFSAIAGSPTDLLADDTATYITQIRDFGSVVTGTVQVEIDGTQVIESTWNDQHEHIIESVTEVGEPTNNVLVDSSFGGIGHIIGFANATALNFRYDANNQTRMSGGIAGNVYAIHMHGNFTNDEANANVTALIAGVINANAIALGETYWANGDSTGGNTMANLAVAGSSYYLIDMKQYNDFGAAETYQGDIGKLTTQTFIRTSSADPSILYFANGNVNVAAFDSFAVNDGFGAYEAGSRTFRHFQLKYVINNLEPDQYDFTIDKFRYSINKEITQFSAVVTYDGSPKSVDYSSSGFTYTPNVSFQVIQAATAQTAVVPTISETGLTFTLWDNEAGALVPTTAGVKVQITADGV
jgi:hypothetical protein